jgi:hypothetical protein
MTFETFGGITPLEPTGWGVTFDVVKPGQYMAGTMRKGQLEFAFDARIQPTGQHIPGVDAGFDPMNAPSAYTLDKYPDLYRELYDALMRAAFSPTWLKD